MGEYAPVLRRVLAGVVGGLIGGLGSLVLAFFVGVGGWPLLIPIVLGTAIGAIWRDRGVLFLARALGLGD